MSEDDPQRPPLDSRRFFMLPQSPMDSGYYVYGRLHGKPARGAYQYAHPTMMTAILRVALEWQAIDQRRMGVGDISLAGGIRPQIMTRTGQAWKWTSAHSVKTAESSR